MKKFEKRLKLIEKSFHFDSSGLAPGSEAWERYWDGALQKSFAGEPCELIPLAAFRSGMKRGGTDDEPRR